MRASSLCPPRARPRRRVILVLAPLSSTNTRAATASAANCLYQPALLAATSGRSRSAAARVFFKPPSQPPQPEIDRGSAERAVQAGAQLGQGGIGLRRQQFAQSLFALLGEQGLAPTPIGPRLQRAALAKLLAHAAYRRHTEAAKLRDLLGALAPLVKFQNALAEGNRNSSHA